MDFEAVKQVDRYSRIMCKHGLDSILMAEYGDGLAGVDGSQLFKLIHHTGLYIQHQIAIGCTRKAAKGVKPLPSGVGAKLVHGLAGPVAEIDFDQSKARFHLQIQRARQWLCCFQCSLQRTAVDGADGRDFKRSIRASDCFRPSLLIDTPGVWPAIALPIQSVWPCRISRKVVISLRGRDLSSVTHEDRHLRTFDQLFVGKRACNTVAGSLPRARGSRTPGCVF